jgi:hypothetical protein
MSRHAGEKKEAKPVPVYGGDGSIYGDFIHCVKTREALPAPSTTRGDTMSVCHMGIIAYELKRSKWNVAGRSSSTTPGQPLPRPRPSRAVVL